MGEIMNEFDVSRAIFRDRDLFSSFHVKTTYPLRLALSKGNVREKNPILVMEHNAGVLTFLTQQIVSHHLAYGETAGQPWMVIF